LAAAQRTIEKIEAESTQREADMRREIESISRKHDAKVQDMSV